MGMRKITIGADPEFMIITGDGKALPAREICDDGDNSNHFGRERGQNGYVFELRPDPSTDVFSVIANIRKILRIHMQQYPYLKKCTFTGGHIVETETTGRQTGHGSFAVGGHIHIGIIGDLAYELDNDKFRHFLNKIIFNGFMGVINDKKNHSLRKKIGYGKAGDFRASGEDSLQYKTPPSWLVSPTLAFMFLTLAKICGLLYINRQSWRVAASIDGMVIGKDKGLVLLKRLSAIVKMKQEMMQEEDIQECLKIIDNLPQRHKGLSWQKDFKLSWGL